MAINLANPVNSADPLMRGVSAMWRMMPSTQRGVQWASLVGPTPGTLISTSYGSAYSRNGGHGSVIFNGSSSYITVADHSRLNVTTGSATWSFWVYMASYVDGVIWAKGLYATSGWYIHLNFSGDGNGAVSFHTMYNSGRTATITNAGEVPTGSWQHIVITMSSGTNAIYRNGISAGLALAGGGDTFVANSSAMELGRYPAASNYSGCLADEFILWKDRALSANDVQKLYTQSRLGYPTALNRIRPTYGFIAGGGGGAVTVRPRSLLTLGCGC